MKKILAIDDQQDNLITVKAVLKNQLPACKVLTALKPLEGIDLAKKELPDVILLDIIMPEMDGFSVCEELKKDELTRHIPVVMITAIKTDTKSRVKGLSVGADAFLSKPIDPVELSAQVKVMLRIKEAEDEIMHEKRMLEKEVEKRNQELILSNNRYREAQKIGKVGNWEYDIETTCFWGSDEAKRIYGFDSKSVSFTTEEVERCIPEREWVRQALTDLIEKNKKYDIEFDIIPYNKGARKTIHSIAKCSRDEKGNPIKVTGVIHDITDRKKQEQQVRISEEKYRALYENAPLAYQSLDTHGVFLDVNPAWLEILGYKREEVIGKTFKEFLHLRWQASFDERFSEFKEKGEVNSLHLKIKHKKEHYLDVEFEGGVGYNLDGSIRQMYCVFHDITSRIKSEKALNSLASRFSALTSVEFFYRVCEHIAATLKVDVVFIGEYIQAEASVLVKAGVSRRKKIIPYLYKLKDTPCEQVIGKEVCSFSSGVSKRFFKYKYLEENNIESYIGIPLFSRAGEPLGVIVMLDRKPLVDADFSISLLNIFSERVSAEMERSISEHALQESEKRYRTLMENLPVGVFRSSYEGEVLSANFAMAQIYGYDSVEELLKLPAKDYYGAENPREKVLEDLQEKGYLLGYETLEYKKDGSLFWVSSNYKANYDEHGKIETIDGVVTDITEQKRTEEELKEALEKATESDRLKSAFLATMSHELRTPLNAIIGFSDIISDELPMEDILKFNENVNSSGKHLLTIVEDLFDITLIEAGEVKIKKSTQKINTVFKEVYDIMLAEQIQINKDYLSLSYKLTDEQKEMSIYTDISKLKQVLINLLKNALKFTHEGGVKFGFNIEKEGEGLSFLFYVEDTGIGIPEDKRDFIFDVFCQVEETHNRLYGGVGIGLTISKKLVNLLGGKIWLESRVDKGTIFYFTIPVEENQLEINDENVIIKVKSKSHDNITILIAEDDDSSYEYMKAILAPYKLNIEWVQDGKSAVEFCKNNNHVDLILMDVNMPVMNGYEATRLIKDMYPDIPIIAQTAYAIIGDKEKSLQAGCDDYLSKPVKKDDLLLKIKKYITL